MSEQTSSGTWIRMSFAFGVLGLAGTLACASVPPPREQVARARERVTSAQTEQASQFAPLELRKAQDDLESAVEALREERNIEARRSAERAEVQAELALARTERGKNEAAVGQLRDTLRALQEELERSAGNSAEEILR